jgi:hypothetical protein
MELISLTRAAFIGSESVGGDFSAVAAEGVLGSGEGLSGWSSVGGAATISSASVSRGWSGAGVGVVHVTVDAWGCYAVGAGMFGCVLGLNNRVDGTVDGHALFADDWISDYWRWGVPFPGVLRELVGIDGGHLRREVL